MPRPDRRPESENKLMAMLRRLRWRVFGLNKREREFLEIMALYIAVMPMTVRRRGE